MKSLTHDSALTHVTGESEYIDDRPALSNELQVGVVFSEKAHAKLKKIDLSGAEKTAGFAGAFLAKDFAHAHWGTIFQDQPFLAEDTVKFVGEGIVVIAAETLESLRACMQAVKITYEELPPILSIEDARKKKSFIGAERSIARGDIETALAQAPHRIDGSITIQGQDHFYLESQASVVYPKEKGAVEVHSSSQHPTETQHVVAHALGIPYKDVVCIVKRMGGGFGGKESQAAPFAAYAAVVAQRLKRPARIALTKDDDMIMTGKRNPFQNFYQIGFDATGKILALDAQLFSDGGAYADLSTSIMERAMLHSDNAYYIPNMRVVGQVCRTNYHPHTAFRGFGGPKGVAMIEKAIEEIASFLGKDALEIRKLNVYQNGADTTHYGQRLKNNLLPKLFSELEERCEYQARRREITEANRAAIASGSPFPRLRGLSLTAVKFGISFTTRFLNQGNALVIVHRDGTLQVSTGATEMGQGVNIRIAALVAEELGIDPANIQVMATSTEKNANTSPTAASSGTDINGMAAVMAAKKIKARLAEVAQHLLSISHERWAVRTAGLGTEEEVIITHAEDAARDFIFQDGFVSRVGKPEKKIDFVDLVREAYLNRVSLSEYAFYRIPNLFFDKLTGKGDAFMYFTQGVAATEVSIDSVTGEVKVLRTDILMDLGRPINTALDIGQVTGAYVQGLGWVTTENLFYSAGGKLLSHSPSTYKIPSIQDTPRTFNIELLENLGNEVNVRGTKAVGEPPLLLAISAWTAIGDAIRYAKSAFPNLTIPATSERVLRALSPERFKTYEAGKA